MGISLITMRIPKFDPWTHPAGSKHPGYDDEDAGEMAIHYLSRGEHFAREGAGTAGDFLMLK